MTGNRHDRSALEAFLDDDFRQVWAVDRTTGEPHYLPEGEAEALRTVAKAQWRCPVPGCEVEITTVGGSSRRHHFRHNQPSPHPSDGESEFHLAAKAMLADWAAARIPPAAVVQEERSTQKDPATSRYRVADVMVDWGTGDQTALEVEYKTFAPEAWELKQHDYDTHQPQRIACVWLLGHLRVRRPPRNSWAAGDPRVVRIPLLGQRWIEDGRPVLVVNPVTREVGTIVNQYARRDAHARYPVAGDAYGRLVVDPLDSCELHPQLGLVTPTMRHIEEAEAARRQEEERVKRANAARREAHQARQRQQSDAWASSELFGIFAERWNELPTILSSDTHQQHGIRAYPVHWRGVIYERFFRQNSQSASFTLTDIYTALDQNGIRRHYDKKVAFQAVISFMERLQQYGLVAIRRNEHGYVDCFSPTGVPIEASEAASRRVQEQNRLDAESRRQQAQAEEHRRLEVAGARALRPTFAELVDAATRRRRTPRETPAERPRAATAEPPERE